MLFCNFLIADNIQRSHTKVEIKGIDQKNITKASNGNIYIRNAKIDANQLENNQVSIKGGSDAKKIIISNIKIRSRNTSTVNKNSNNAILAISSNQDTDIRLKNIDIDSHNVKQITHSRSENICAGALCIQGKNNNIDIKNLDISSSSLNAEVHSSKSNSRCVGALCIQSENSVISLENILVEDKGSTLYKVKD